MQMIKNKLIFLQLLQHLRDINLLNLCSNIVEQGLLTCAKRLLSNNNNPIK